LLRHTRCFWRGLVVRAGLGTAVTPQAERIVIWAR
jgi:hypothetical protein